MIEGSADSPLLELTRQLETGVHDLIRVVGLAWLARSRDWCVRSGSGCDRLGREPRCDCRCESCLSAGCLRVCVECGGEAWEGWGLESGRT